MSAQVRNPLWLAVLPVAVCLLDVGLTLRGQPASYWEGDYATVDEGNPLPRLFLEAHPLAFAAGMMAYLVCVCAAALFLPRRLAVYACVGVTAGHAVGAAAWLLRDGPFSPWSPAVLLLAVLPPVLRAWRMRRG